MELKEHEELNTLVKVERGQGQNMVACRSSREDQPIIW